MLVRVFTLKFHVATEGFDDEEVQEFIKDKEVLSIREHFFMRHATPYLTLVIKYLPGTPESAPSKKSKDAWRELLSNEQMPLFESLREWRAERAKQDGVPPYIICTNEELAQMVTQRPNALAGLIKIHGFGKAKAEKYGKEILAVLATPRATKQPGAESSEKEQSPPSQQPVSQQAMFDVQSEQATSVKSKAPQSKGAV